MMNENSLVTGNNGNKTRQNHEDGGPPRSVLDSRNEGPHLSAKTNLNQGNTHMHIINAQLE